MSKHLKERVLSSYSISRPSRGLRSTGAEYLKLRVKHISQNIIHSNWVVLDRDAQGKVEELLRSVELPVLANYPSEPRKVEAQVALRAITEK